MALYSKDGNIKSSNFETEDIEIRTVKSLAVGPVIAK